MKNCPKCGKPFDDNVAFCDACGTPLNGAPAPVAAVPVVDPTDHTAEFDPKDISENKVLAMVPYLMGWIGIIIALAILAVVLPLLLHEHIDRLT